MSDVMYQASTADPTWKIWKHFPKRISDADPRKVFLHHEEFIDFPTSPTLNAAGQAKGFTTYLDTGSTVVDSGDANSHGAVRVGTDGDNEACTFAMVSTPIRITRGSGRKVAFGVRVKFSTIADTKNGAFFGLWESLTPTATSHIADAGTLADKNFVGFHRLEGDGDQLDVVYKADGITQVSFADAQVLVADTYVKAELFFDGASSLTFWFNGTQYATADLGYTALGATAFPSDINLAPVLVMAKNATGTTPGTNVIDWMRFGYTMGDAD